MLNSLLTCNLLFEAFADLTKENVLKQYFFDCKLFRFMSSLASPDTWIPLIEYLQSDSELCSSSDGELRISQAHIFYLWTAVAHISAFS
jgi:hypothetical protein